MKDLAQAKIAVIGLGYVGLPLAVEFGKKYPVVGFDLKEARVRDLRAGVDRTLETEVEELRAATGLVLTSNAADLKGCNTFIVTVPTPVDESKRPDLSPLDSASRIVGGVLAPGAVVVYESTVYPGCTEEYCVPILEKASGLVFNRDFFVGYSPERINPGDKEHRLPTIRKITSGSTSGIADYVDRLYGSIIRAGTYRASSIRVAEAAKVIENTQRDVNIALINELAMLFGRMGIDTQEVLLAAGTKWNFLPFRPGLVGGHCIGVDPYYLTHKAETIGYHPQMILAGRRINDNMGAYVAGQVLRRMVRKKLQVVDARILVLGMTFKENCPDIRNSKVIDIVRELEEIGAKVEVYEPWVGAEEIQSAYGVAATAAPEAGVYDAIVLAVGHRQFRELGAAKIREWGRPVHVLYDVKSLFPASETDGRL